jgi:photosystem II stability/assembly factor-like uncharacterized protein
MNRSRLCLAIAGLIAVWPAPVHAQVSNPLDSATLAAFRWRSVGPANMSGRVTDIEGIGSPSKTFYVATAAGGIWKTTNNGTTFRPLFTDQRVISMGDLAIAPSDTNIVWAGTGEEDSRNSISPGGGIYKSTDGGMTWQLMGLEETQTIGRIVVHPTNPDIVYVAALGHIWDSNPERGLYKTTDGGETWDLVKFISDKAGFVDLAMHPQNPDILFAASWERVRGPYFLQSGGSGSALWKTTDGGATWAEVEGNGFPESMKGRIGIAIAASNPDIVYAIVEAEATEDDERPNGLYRSEDGGESWTKMNGMNSRPFYYSQVRVDTQNPDRVYWSTLNFSDDGGETVGSAAQGVHVDHHAVWIDPADSEHMVIGNDGGVAQTWDRGGNYQVLNTFAIGQFYAVDYNMEVPYRVCGGLQDNGTWCGPSRRRQGGINNAMWSNVGGGDGFYTAQHPVDPDIIFVESQGGNMSRMDYATGERTQIAKPNWRESYRFFQDSIILARGDTTRPETDAMRRRIADLSARASADSAMLDMRWNWSTPFFLSPHDPNTFYTAASRVLKSTNLGEDLQVISPDLTTQDTMRIRISTTTTGGITRDVTGAETHSTIVALAESPIDQGTLFAGTDDGNVWMSSNDGEDWENLTDRFPGVPPKTWVSRIEPSSHNASTFYVSFDNHRENDFTPYLYVTTNGGRSFSSIANDLPTGAPDFIHVIREDPVNPNLLFVGTDVGAYMSMNRGYSWQKFMTGLPTVPVHDLKIHPRDRELIAATHGRSIWIVDIAPLQQLTDDVILADAHLFEPRPAYQFTQSPIGGGSNGHQFFQVPSPQYGAEIVYRVTSGSRRDGAQIAITDAQGDTVRTLEGPGGAGMHRVMWDFRGTAPPAGPLSPSQVRDSVVRAQRMDVVFDSLAEAGADAQALQRMRANFEGGGNPFGRRFGRGGRGGETGFVERPGERVGGGGGPGGFGGGAAPGGLDVRQIARLLNPGGGRGGFGGFGGGGGGGAPLAEAGEYWVHVTVGGETYTQRLRVEEQ